MARADHDVRVTSSVLDRLLDEDPGNSRDVIPTRAESVRELRRGVQRDLEYLLNTRNPFEDLPPEFAEVGRSVIAYGLPDVGSIAVDATKDQPRLRQLIETSIRNFEPRLAGVSIAALAGAAAKGTVRMRIDARLMVEPAPEPVTFDVIMPLTSKRCEVKETD